MIQSSKVLLRALAHELARGLSPSRWELTLDDAVRALARVTDHLTLVDTLAPVAIFLEGASSGAALDLAYGTADAADELQGICRKLADEIGREREWLATHPHTWASGLAEVDEVLTAFDALTAELRRVAAAC